MWLTVFRERQQAFICFIFFAVPLLTQGQDVPFLKAYGPEEYQAAPQNWSIQALHSGIVTGNSAGLLMYDGEHWSSYPMPGNHQARAVLHLRDTIFSGSYGEFGFWTRNQYGSWAYQSLSRNLHHPLTAQEEIWHIAAFPGGILFQSFSTIYLLKGGRISIITPPYSTGIMFASWWNHSFFLQIIGQGIAQFDPITESFTLVAQEHEFHNGKIIGLQAFRGDLVIATDTEGLFSYDGHRITRRWPELSDILSANQVNKMIEVDDLIVLGTILDGVYVIDSAGEVQEHLNHSSGLPDNTVLSLAKTGKGKFWVGLDYGLAYINLNAAYRRFRDQTAEIGVVFDVIDHHNTLYLGTNHGLFRQAPGNNRSAPFTIVPGTQGQVWSLNSIGGRLYCGHNSGTLLITEDKVERVSAVTGAWSWLKSEEGEWIQGTYTGLVKVQYDQHSLPVFSRIAGFNYPIRDLTMDQEGWIWGVAPYKGVYRIRLNQERDSVVEVSVDPSQWGLPDDNRLALARIDRHIYAKTDSGWFRLDEELRQFAPANQIRGLRLSRDIQRLVQIDHGIIAFQDHSIHIHSDQPTQFLEIGSVTNPPACKEMIDGSIFIGSSSGYVLVNPALQKTVETADLHITSMVLLQKQTQIPLPISGSEEAAVKLLPSDVGISVTVSSGITDEEQLYRFRSPGIEIWSEWSREASFTFPILSTGTQVIEIQRQSDGQIQRIVCQKAAPWYLRPWAILMYVLAFLGINFLGIRAFQRQTSRRWKKKQIERERARHAKEVEQKNEMLTANLAEQNQELAGITMNLVRKNEVIYDMKEQLKELSMLEKEEATRRLRQLQLTLNSTLSSEKDWEAFEYHFTRVHPGFFTGLKNDFPTLTSGDLRLAAYLRMNLSSKEIAPLLHITVRSLENRRYRLRKKLALDHEQQIIDLLLQY